MTTETLTVMMPRALTAENGAKALLMGEFFEEYESPCAECSDLVEPAENCNYCNGHGVVKNRVSVTWTTIKAIYAKAVEHFAT